jgi:predicted nucleotidyltransferase
MLEKLFSSKVRVELLTLFLTHPGERYYTRQLERLLGRSPRALQQELHRLESIGLLRSQAEANVKYYTADPDFPLYPELQRIILKTTGVGDVLRYGLSNVEGVEWAFVYGSAAAGNEDRFSDIDIMVVGTLDLEALSQVVSRLENDLARPINYIMLSLPELIERLGRGDAFWHNVMASPKVFLVGDENAILQAVAAEKNPKL